MTQTPNVSDPLPGQTLINNLPDISEDSAIPDREGWIYALPIEFSEGLTYIGSASGAVFHHLSYITGEKIVVQPQKKLTDITGDASSGLPPYLFVNLLEPDNSRDSSINRDIEKYLKDHNPNIVSILTRNPLSPFSKQSIKERWRNLSALKSIPNIFSNRRKFQTTFNGILDTNQVIFELIPKSGYTSTQNSFTVKEKLKNILYRPPLGKIFQPNLLITIRSIETRENTFVDKLLDNISHITDAKSIHIEKWLVLLGKTILLVSSETNETGYVIVITSNQRTISRRRREFKALEALKNMDESVSRFIPDTYPEIRLQDKIIFVMQRVSGISIEGDFTEANLATESAARFITKLHKLTYDPKYQVAGVINDIISNITLRYGIQSPELGKIFTLISNQPSITQGAVFQHGDFKLENLLFTKSNLTLNGVIDWELCKPKGLLLLDILYLVYYNRSSRENADVLDLFDDLDTLIEFNAFERNLIIHYCDALDIDFSALNYFIVLFYLHHIGDRFVVERTNSNIQQIRNTLSNLEDLLTTNRI